MRSPTTNIRGRPSRWIHATKSADILVSDKLTHPDVPRRAHFANGNRNRASRASPEALLITPPAASLVALASPALPPPLRAITGSKSHDAPAARNLVRLAAQSR